MIRWYTIYYPLAEALLKSFPCLSQYDEPDERETPSPEVGGMLMGKASANGL